MAETYSYRVRDSRGALVTGEIVGDGEAQVLSKLREMDYIPLDVKRKTGGLKTEIVLRPGHVGLKPLAVFSRQFATMVNSGLPLLRSLAILEEQTESKQLAKVLVAVRTDIERGDSLSAAFDKHPRAFPDLYVAMCKAGEAAGNLDSVLLRLADTLEREVSLRRKIRSAMTYPTVVLVMAVVIFLAMLLFIVPTFKQLYADLGGTLPLPTRMLLRASDAVASFWWVFLLAVVVLAVGFRRWIKTARGRYVWDRLKLRIPVFGPLLLKTALSRFSRNLGALTRAGVPILQALEIVRQAVKNELIGRAVDDVQAGVKEGEQLAHPLARHKVFPAMVVQMLAVGEETGALDTMLDKIADFYDDEVTAAVDTLTSMIEPILIAIVGGIVGGMVISLYLPMFKIVELIE